MDTPGVFLKTCSGVLITELYLKGKQMYRVKKRSGHSESASLFYTGFMPVPLFSRTDYYKDLHKILFVPAVIHDCPAR